MYAQVAAARFGLDLRRNQGHCGWPEQPTAPRCARRGGVSYYDLQNATQPGLTDAYLVTCPAATSDCSNPTSWAAGGQTLLSATGSFDMTTAPNAEGFFVGDYEGLTSTGSTFDPFFVMASRSRPRAHRPVRQHRWITGSKQTPSRHHPVPGRSPCNAPGVSGALPVRPLLHRVPAPGRSRRRGRGRKPDKD
jgi:hypothetical protein